jgi:PKD-like domain/Secretion system C-terminal sorting domain
MKNIFSIFFFIAIYVNGSFAQSTASANLTGGTIAGSQTICSGDNPAAFTEIVTATGNNLTYQWQSSSNGTTFSINGLPATPMYDVPAGLISTTYYRRIAISVNNTIKDSAYSNIINIKVINKATAASTITGFSGVCNTQNGVSYAVTEIKDVKTYVWSYTGIGATVKDSSNSTSINFSATATSGTLTVTGINACGKGIASPPYNVTVYPLPQDARAITGTSTVCQGQTTIFYSTPTLANTDNYTWEYTGTGAFISGSTNSITIDFLPTATSGILTVKGLNQCTNGNASPAFPITVNTTPQGSFIGNSICTGDVRKGQLTWIGLSNTSLYDIVYNDGTANRTQNAVLSGQSFDVFTQPTITNDYKLISVTSNNCSRTSGFNKDTATITVASQVATILVQPSNVSVCRGSGTSFTVSTSGAYAYQWQVSTDGGSNYLPITSSGSLPTYSNYNTANLSISGTTISNNDYLYKCAIAASCGNDIISNAARLTIHQLPDSAGTINGLARVCQKQNGVIYSIPQINNATDYVWTYTGTGATLTVSTNSVTINFSEYATSGYLKVMGVTPYCNGPTSVELFILVILSPTSAGLITGPHVVCQNQTDVSYKVPLLHGSHSTIDDPTFTWAYTGTGATISGPTDPMTINFSENATSGILTVMRTQACGNGQISPNYTITVNPAPEKPSTIVGSDTICQPGKFLFSTPTIIGTTKYIWKYTGIATITSDSSNSLSMDFSTTATSGNLTVQPINSTCKGLVSNNYPINFITCITGTEEIGLTNKVTLFPNPNEGIFNLTIENATFNNLSLRIIDAIGKEVFVASDKNASTYYNKQINLSALSKGIYYVRLLVNAEIKTFKVIVN